MKQKNWLIIEPYVYIEIGQEKILLYNTLNKIIKIVDEPISLRLFNKNNDKNLLGIIEIQEKELKDINFQVIIKELMKEFMVDILTSNQNSIKPVQIPPLLKVEEFLPDHRKQNEQIISNNIVTFVDEINIYINNGIPKTDKYFFQEGFKQFLTVRSDSNEYNELGLSVIKDFYNRFSKHSLKKINVLGNNIMKYSTLKEMVAFLNSVPHFKNYFIYFEDFKSDSLQFLSQVDTYSMVHIIFYNFVDKNGQILEILQTIQNFQNIILDFYISTDRCIDHVENLKSKIGSVNYCLFPFFNEENRNLLSSTISFSRNDIHFSDLSIKKILIRKKINENLFGNLSIFTNGDVYSNCNFPKLGNINTNDILEMLFIEVNHVKSWFFTRNDVIPCKTCLYKNLCPPISNLELYLQKFDFCSEFQLV